MGGSAAGSKLGYTGKEAQEKGQELLDNFFTGFSKVKEAIDQSKEYLKKNGYVEDFVGRRRRLPDINLEPYTAKYLDETKSLKDTFNPFLNCQDRVLLNEDITIWNQILLGYCILNNVWKLAKASDLTQTKIVEEVSNSTFEWLANIAFNPVKMLNQGSSDPKKPINNFKNKSNRQKILSDMELLQSILKTKAYKNIDLSVNTDFVELLKKYIDKYKYNIPMQIPETRIKLMAYTARIAQASRQCLNARIQGSAASLTKIAMVDLFNDPILKELQAKLIITVHDEVLLECPEYYAEAASKRISEIMVHAAAKVGDDVPQSCDPYIVTRWYADEYAAAILDEFKKLEKTQSREEAIQQIYKNHSEIPQEALLKTLETGCDLDF